MHTHEITTEPVLPHLALRCGLVKIVLVRTNDETGEVCKFALPVQWTQREAGELIHQIRGLTWQISGDGLPGDYEGIKEICNAYLHALTGYVEPLSTKWRKK
jgi:hypothetical protein